MDTTFWMLLVITAAMLGACWHARRIGNERRDVMLLGIVAGLLASGTAAAAIF